MTGTTDGGIGWRWLDTRLHRRAYRKVRSGPAPSRLRRLATAAVAAVVHVGSLAMLVTGAWLCTVRFPGVALLPGGLLLIVGALILPKPAPLPRYTVTADRAETPALHALVDRVAAALGVPPPHVVALDDRFAADSGVAGLLRRRYLCIGAPLWAVLDPAQRTALVALELARFGAGDPSRSALTGTVERSLATAVAMFEPAGAKRLQQRREEAVTKMTEMNPGTWASGEHATNNLMEVLVRPFTAVLQGFFGLVRLGYVTLLQPESFRAVLAADGRAAAVAGAEQVRAVLATRLLAEPMVTVLRSDARAGELPGVMRRDEPETVVAGWPALAAGVVAKNAPTMAQRCEADVERAASAFAVTPPLGRRIEALALGDAAAVVPVDVQESATTDVEMRPMYRRLVRDLRHG